MHRPNIIRFAEVNAALAQIKSRAPESAEIQKLRADAAKSDLRRVKRYNMLGIGQTGLGFVEPPPRVGVLTSFWRWLFGDPPVEKRPAIEPGRQCGCPAYENSPGRCAGIADPFCYGGNCTAHCREHCGKRCLGARE
jgi:hypothetical protein